MATTIDYPSQLPLPQQSGYAIQHVSPLVRVDMQSGRARQRRRFTSVPSLVKVNWLMNEVQAQLFEGWFRWTITDGADWFNCRIKTPMGLRPYECRFTDIYDGPVFVTTSLWRFSAELEIRDRQTISALDAQFPDEIIQSDLFDRTVNQHWPAS
jgi:hypothetical protein